MIIDIAILCILTLACAATGGVLGHFLFNKISVNKIKCFFLGHKVVSMIVESETSINDRGCARCGCGIGLPYYKSYNCPPPSRKGATAEERKADLEHWRQFIDNECKRIRETGKIFDELWLMQLKTPVQKNRKFFIENPSGSTTNGSTSTTFTKK